MFFETDDKKHAYPADPASTKGDNTHSSQADPSQKKPDTTTDPSKPKGNDQTQTPSGAENTPAQKPNEGKNDPSQLKPQEQNTNAGFDASLSRALAKALEDLEAKRNAHRTRRHNSSNELDQKSETGEKKGALDNNDESDELEDNEQASADTKHARKKNKGTSKKSKHARNDKTSQDDEDTEVEDDKKDANKKGIKEGRDDENVIDKQRGDDTADTDEDDAHGRATNDEHTNNPSEEEHSQHEGSSRLAQTADLFLHSPLSVGCASALGAGIMSIAFGYIKRKRFVERSYRRKKRL